MARSFAIEARGLKELHRDFKAAGDGLDRELNQAMRRVGDMVAGTAREVAAAKGLRDTGRLIGSIKGGSRGPVALVRATAKNRGYPYAGRYEYGDRDRPFLRPAIARDETRILEMVEDAVGELLRRADLD